MAKNVDSVVDVSELVVHNDPAASGVVPVERMSCSGPTVASLVIGVGQRDESAHQAGITHLAEHLLLRLAGPDPMFMDGETTVSTVSFSAAGAPEDAVAFLGRVATAIRNIKDLTDEQVALEKKILEAELTVRFHEAIPSLSTLRFGTKGFGLLGAGNPAIATITRNEVIDWVGTWFTADNAVVTVAGDPSQDVTLSLPLGTAPRPVRVTDVPSITTPVLVPTWSPGVALSLVVPVDDAPSLNLALSWDLFQSLRIEQGLCYSADVTFTRVDPLLVTLEIVIDCIPGSVSDTVVAAVTLLRKLADTGFSAEAVGRVHQAVAMTRLDPDEVPRIRLADSVAKRLSGYETSDIDEELTRGALTDFGHLKSSLRASLDSLIVMYDEDAEVGDLGTLTGIRIDEFEPINPISHKEFRSRSQGSQSWRSHILPSWSRGWATVTDGVLLLSGRKGGWAIDVGNAALLGRRSADGVVMILGADGRRLNVWAKDWWRGAALIDAITDAAPSDRVRDFPADN